MAWVSSSPVPKPKQNIKKLRDHEGWTACKVQDKHKEIRDIIKNTYNERNSSQKYPEAYFLRVSQNILQNCSELA